MSEVPPHREGELAFFGRMGAHVSHEMRNVLSIIGEYAGLLADLLEAAEAGRPLDSERLKQLSRNIAGQVAKGTETMQRFSRFAHAADQQTASLDLTALVEDLVALAQRHATRAGCTLKTQLPNEAIAVTGNPFRLQHLVFSAIELLLAALENGESVTVRLHAEGSTAVVTMLGKAPITTDEWSARVSQLSAAANESKAVLDTSCTEGILSLTLAIPIQ
ncbi:MAG: hypothetical protein A2V70_12590 [Planctomycetes bacterium RBG_13_63_9]|nr:MAG: hypothetical protein A2V70_12590 [Planctomycetes bacterium RBG_13_63_9]